ncbi:traf2 and NCK-interacting protein kinase, partial [Pleuronectes platessa]|uniref:traf2 and NCK-interacting protein kinase n=1 Tax=Pleuronectes platessa TaxID=8262 RepID=UPI00232A0E45
MEDQHLTAWSDWCVCVCVCVCVSGGGVCVYKMNKQSSLALQHKVSNRISDPSLPPRSESFSSGGIQQARTPPMHRSVEPQVPQRTTSISPALVRRNSPGNGPGLGPRAGAHLIRASNPDLRRIDVSMDTPLKRTSSSSSSSTPSSQGGSNERGNSSNKTEGSTLSSHDAKDDRGELRPSRPADLTALAKELRELRQGEDTSRPPVKVTDYSSSSEDSHSSEDEDGEGGANDGSVAVSDIPRIMPAANHGANESFNLLGGHNAGHQDAYGNSSQDGTLRMREFGGGSGGGSKSSFTPFVDPRVYGTSPTDDDDNTSASALFADELLKQEQE